MLQQYLPFTVLKQLRLILPCHKIYQVATVPTVYGIETMSKKIINIFNLLVATVPTVYGIETL